MKVSYANLKLKTKTDIKEFDFQDNKIEVLQYLPAEEKYALVMTLVDNNRMENGLYDHVRLDVCFHLLLVYAYSNLNFTEKQKENEDKIYDALMSNGLMDMILSNIPESEYNYLYHMINRYVEDGLKYNMTAASIIKTFITDLPKQAAAANEIVEKFNPENFKAVLNFAKAANGGRDI